MSNIIKVSTNASVCDVIQYNAGPKDPAMLVEWRVDDKIPLGIPAGDYVLESNFGYRYEFVYSTVKLHPQMTQLDILLLVHKGFEEAFCVNTKETGTPVVAPPNMSGHEVLIKRYGNCKQDVVATPFLEVFTIDPVKMTIETFIGS